MDKRFTIGSRAFFDGMEGFHPKDNDILILQDEPNGYKFIKQLHTFGHCFFYCKRMNPNDYIEYMFSRGPAMQLGKFLVPDFVKEVGFTIEDLKSIAPLLNRLDKVHCYEKVIFNAYVVNGGFFLTDNQRMDAFKEYKKERKHPQLK